MKPVLALRRQDDELDDVVAKNVRMFRAEMMDAKTLAALLSLSERTIRSMLSEGRIPSYRVEGVRRIAAEDVDAYLAARRNG